MRVIDFLGNTIETGDAVAVDLAHVIGVVSKIEDGSIARGIITGDKPAGEVLPPHVVIEIRATQAMLIQAPQGSPVGQVAGIVKIAKPEQAKVSGQ
jgi:hypothetical protein